MTLFSQVGVDDIFTYPKLPCARCEAAKHSLLLLLSPWSELLLLLKSIRLTCIWSKQWWKSWLWCPGRRECVFLNPGIYIWQRIVFGTICQVASKWHHLAASTVEVRTAKTSEGRSRRRGQVISPSSDGTIFFSKVKTSWKYVKHKAGRQVSKQSAAVMRLPVQPLGPILPAAAPSAGTRPRDSPVPANPGEAAFKNQ